MYSIGNGSGWDGMGFDGGVKWEQVQNKERLTPYCLHIDRMEGALGSNARCNEVARLLFNVRTQVAVQGIHLQLSTHRIARVERSGSCLTTTNAPSNQHNVRTIELGS